MTEDIIPLEKVIEQMIAVLSLNGTTSETRYEADRLLRMAITEAAAQVSDAINYTKAAKDGSR